MLSDAPGHATPPSFAVAPSRFGHTPACACCAPRSAAAVALAEAFRARATGQVFRAVVADVSPATEAAIRLALDTDLLASARFRLA